MAVAPRILSVVGSRVLYGQERANLLVLETLKAQGCTILAVVENHPAFRAMPQQLDNRGIPYVETPFINRRHDGYLLDFLVGNPLRYIRLRKQLSAVIQEFRPTHVHVPNPFALLMADAIAPQDLPIIYRIGDQPATHHAIWRWIWRRITRRVTHFVAISEFIANELDKLGVPRERITVIYNAPTARSIPPQPEKRPESPQKLLFIGQISADKGVDRLVDAFRIVAAEFPLSSLTIVGRISDWSGDDWARSLKRATLQDPVIGDRVQFPGESEQIYKFLADAAVLVVPSVSQEPLSNVVVEAKAAARPSVVFPSGGLPELIQHEADGFICRDTSVEALACGLRYYLSNPDRTRIQGDSALGSLQRFKVDSFGDRWREVYDWTMPKV